MEYRTYNVTLPECGYFEEMDIDDLDYGYHYEDYGDDDGIELKDEKIYDSLASDVCGEAIKSDEFVCERFECYKTHYYYKCRANEVRIILEGHYEIKNVRLLTEESFNELSHLKYDTYKDYVVETIEDLLDQKYEEKWNETPWIGFDYRAYDRFESEGNLDGYYQGILIEEVK